MPGSKAKGSNRKIVESASDKSAPSSPIEDPEDGSRPGPIDTKGKGRAGRGTDSSPDVPLSGLPSVDGGSRSGSRAQSREGSPIPFVLQELVNNMSGGEDITGQGTRAGTEDSDIDMDMASVEASAKKLLGTSYNIKTEARDSIEPRSRQPSLAPSLQAPSEADGLSVQGDDEGTVAGTPADERQVEVSVNGAPTAPTTFPAKRKRGRPPKKGQAAVPTTTIATRASPMPVGAPIEPAKPDLQPSRMPTPAERKAIQEVSVRAEATLQVERDLIEAGQHPLQLEANDLVDRLRAQRLAEFEYLLKLREQELQALVRANERQKWIQWEDEKREVAFEIGHSLDHDIRRLELENSDSDYSKPFCSLIWLLIADYPAEDIILCPLLPIEKPPTVRPAIRLATIDKDFNRGDVTVLPSNGGAIDHSVLKAKKDEVEDDLRIMGLLPVQVKPTPTTVQREKIALQSFPLGKGPPKEVANKRKARFLSSKHPLRQPKPVTPAKKEIKQEVLPVVKQEVQAPQITGRKVSLDRTATKAAAKIAAHKGQSRADAIVLDDASPVMGKYTPLTMESLAAFEQAEAHKARQMAMQGGPSAAMPMFPGRVAPVASAYYNGPQALPVQPSQQRMQPVIAAESPETRPEYDKQGRRIPQSETKPANRTEKARRADLAAQARIQLGIDPPPPHHMMRSIPSARLPGDAQRGFPSQSPPFSGAPPGSRTVAVGQGRPSNAGRQPAPYYRGQLPPHPERIVGWAQDGTPFYAAPPGYAPYPDPRAYYAHPQQQQAGQAQPGQPLHPPPQPGRKPSGEVKPDQLAQQQSPRSQQPSQHHHHHQRAPQQQQPRPRVVSPQASTSTQQQPQQQSQQ